MLGCLFHFGQALFKNLCDKCGLRQEYYDNEALRMWFRRMQALAFVPLDKIENVYLTLVDEASVLFNDKVYEKV